MNEHRQKTSRYATIFGGKNMARYGNIDDFICAGEIKGGEHIIYKKARRPKYHLMIIILEGTMRAIVNGKEHIFTEHMCVNLPTWTEISEIKYGEDFHAIFAATDNTIFEDIFRNRNPFPPDFYFRMSHSVKGDILTDCHIATFRSDINNLIQALCSKDHHFMQEVCYAYFYILLTDMADMVWKKYGQGQLSHYTAMKRPDMLMKQFMHLLLENIETETSVGFYAEQLCISKQYLSLIVKEKAQVPISTIIANVRTDRAAKLLRNPELTIQQIAAMLSFSDQSSFGKFFSRNTGMSPNKYRNSLRKTLLSLRP